jgi:membrane-associated phospholipid phosphatase
MRLTGRVRRSHRPALVAVAALTVVGGLLTPTGIASAQAPADPLSVIESAIGMPADGFGLDQLARIYPSDTPARGTYIAMMDGFNQLRAERPDVIAKNLQTVVDINNSADAHTVDRAIFDNYENREISLVDSLGSNLGAAFLDAYEGGRLPKVKALIGGYLSRAGGLVNSSLIEKEVFDNPRPFVVDPARIVRHDDERGTVYSSVESSGSYPSGHTSGAYLTASLLATMVPELAPQILTRASEVGNSRIVLGVHYPLDVISGRMLGTAAAADRLADPEFVRLVDEAGDELRTVLERETGRPLADVIADDTAYLTTGEATRVYRERMTYGFDRVGASGVPIEVPAEAAALLRGAFPDLTDAQRLQVLEQTALDSGYPLDKTGPQGGWQRIDLAAASAAEVTVRADGSVAVS